MTDIVGTENSDQITPFTLPAETTGNDTIDALGGDDTILTSGGFDTINAGSGNDLLETILTSTTQGYDADLGDGNDIVFASSRVASSFDLGAGEDFAWLSPIAEITDTVTLGAGSDYVVSLTQGGGSLIFTDFQTGAGGDKLHFASWYYKNGQWWFPAGQPGDSGVSNPFGAGFAQLIDSAGGALLQVRSATNAAWTTIVTFQGSTAAQFHQSNFLGWGPDGSAAPATVLDVVEQSRNFIATDTMGDDEIHGTDAGGLIHYSNGNDVIYAGGGDDRISSAGGISAGKKTIYGEGGNDQISINEINGTAPNGQTISATAWGLVFGGDGDDFIGGVGGNDEFHGDAGNDRLGGFGGNDLLYGGAGDDWFTAGSGNDLVDGGSDSDTLQGDAGDDTLIGGSGIDQLFGGTGGDILDGGTGIDSLYGGDGDDTFIIDSPSDLIFEDLGAGNDTLVAPFDIYLGGYANIENLALSTGTASIYAVGNALANTLTGNAGANLLIGGAGDDTVNGGAGNDQLFGEDGSDTLNGDAGIDYLAAGFGNDFLYGGADADALYGEDGDDLLDGGDSFSTDILVGGAGNDTLDGNSGQANPDYDLMDGGAGNDTYWVDTGDDLTFEAVGGGTDTVHANVPVANAGVYLYANVENLVLEGTTAFGVGNELANQLTGSASGNWLLGGAGNDRITGAAGNDVLFGQTGADTFVFGAGSGQDVIGDFAIPQDVIEFASYFTSFAQAQANFVQVGADGAINLGGGNLIVLHGVTMANLTAANFTFAPAAEPPKLAAASLALDPLDAFPAYVAGRLDGWHTELQMLSLF